MVAMGQGKGKSGNKKEEKGLEGQQKSADRRGRCCGRVASAPERKLGTAIERPKRGKELK